MSVLEVCPSYFDRKFISFTKTSKINNFFNVRYFEFSTFVQQNIYTERPEGRHLPFIKNKIYQTQKLGYDYTTPF